MSLRVMFDSNAYDAILAYGDAEKISARIVDGKINSITTHIQKDELLQTRDKQKQALLVDIFHRMKSTTVGTAASLWGISKWGQANWTGDEEKSSLSAIQRNKAIASRDELIGLTAKEHCDVMVTEDNSLRARLIVAAPNLRVLTYAAFRAEFLL